MREMGLGDEVREEENFAELLESVEILAEETHPVKALKNITPIAPLKPRVDKKAFENFSQHQRIEKLRRGQMQIERTLDLHGMGRVQAYAVLRGFIFDCVSKNIRSILVITGKGRPRISTDKIYDKDAGVLRAHLPQWTREPALAAFILDVAQAKPKDGGAGAFYIYLRKKK